MARYYLKFKDFIGIKGFGINKFLSKYYLIHQKKDAPTKIELEKISADLKDQKNILEDYLGKELIL